MHYGTIVLLVMLAGVSVEAQPIATGLVVDEHGRPVAGAEIRSPGGTRVYSRATGAFQLPDSGSVRVRHLGYAPLDTVLQPGRHHRLMLQSSMSRLARVLVVPGSTGSTSTVAAPTVSMSRPELASRPQPGEDLFRAFARVAGVATSETSARLRVRGGAADELLYEFDGVELPDPFHLPEIDAALSMVDLRMVGGIHLHAGVLPLELGNRTAGAVQLTLPPFDGAATATTMSVSLSDVRIAQHVRLGSRSDADLLIRRGYLDLALRVIGEANGLSPQYGNAYARARWHGTRDRLTMHMLRGEDDLRFERSTMSATRSRHRLTMGWLTTVHERQQWQFTSTWALTHRAVRRQVLGSADHGGTALLRDHRETLAASGRLAMQRAIGSRHLVRLGSEWRPAQSTLDVQRTFPDLHLDGASTGDIAMHVLDTLGTHRVSGWLGLRSVLGRGIVQEAGLRADRASWAGGTRLAPRVAWLLPLRHGLALRAGIGVATQSHPPEDRALADGDVTLHPPTHALQRAVTVSGDHAALRWRTDLYWRTTTGERPQYVNARNGAIIAPEVFEDRRRIDVTRGDARGIDVTVREGAAARWRWGVTWTLARTLAEAERRWIRRPWDRRQTLTIDLGRSFGSWLVALGWVLHTGDPTSTAVEPHRTNDDGARVERTYPQLFDAQLPVYHRLDVRIAREWTRGRTHGRLFADLFNAYANRNLLRVETVRRMQADGTEQVMTWRDGGLPRLPSIGVAIDWR